MLQCSQGVARISTPRDAARPKGRHLVGPLSAAETRPDVRVPPLGAIFGFSAPNVARGVLKAPRPIAVAGAIDFAPGGNVDFGCDDSLRAEARRAAAAAAAAAAAGGAAALARARDAKGRRQLPAPCRRARYCACGGVARPSELRVRCSLTNWPATVRAGDTCPLGAPVQPGCLAATVRLAPRAQVHIEVPRPTSSARWPLNPPL